MSVCLLDLYSGYRYIRSLITTWNIEGYNCVVFIEHFTQQLGSIRLQLVVCQILSTKTKLSLLESQLVVYGTSFILKIFSHWNLEEPQTKALNPKTTSCIYLVFAYSHARNIRSFRSRISWTTANIHIHEYQIVQIVRIKLQSRKFVVAMFIRNF